MESKGQDPHAGEATNHVPALDGLRGVAALIVVISHIAQATGLLGGYFGNAGGQIGVMLFFSLSGFLMAHVYARRRINLPAIAVYAVHRVARVVPLYLIVVLGSYLVLAAGISAVRFYPIDSALLASHLLLQDGVSVLWTIPVEMRFYAFFPLFWLLYRISPATMGVVLAALIAAYFLREPASMPGMRLGHYFVMGMACWMAVQVLQPHVPVKAGNALFVTACAALLLVFPLPLEEILGRPLRMWWEPAIFVTVSAFLISAASSAWSAGLLGSGIMTFFGRISYSFYLLHMVVIMNLASVLSAQEHPWLFLLIAAALSTCLAAVSYAALERPLDRFVRSIGARGKAAWALRGA